MYIYIYTYYTYIYMYCCGSEVREAPGVEAVERLGGRSFEYKINVGKY